MDDDSDTDILPVQLRARTKQKEHSPRMESKQRRITVNVNR